MANILVGVLGAGWIALLVIGASAGKLPVRAAVLAILAYFAVAVLVIAFSG
jgi:hypothetical protein